MSKFVKCGCQEPCNCFGKLYRFDEQSSSFHHFRRMFLVLDLLGLSNAPWTAYKHWIAVLGRSVCGNTVAWIEPKVDDVFNCFWFKENCINFGTMVICPFGHWGLDNSPVDFDLFCLWKSKMPPQLGDVPCPVYVAESHDTHIFVPCVGLDACVSFKQTWSRWGGFLRAKLRARPIYAPIFPTKGSDCWGYCGLGANAAGGGWGANTARDGPGGGPKVGSFLQGPNVLLTFRHPFLHFKIVACHCV